MPGRRRDARALNGGVGADHRDLVDRAVAAGLEQQWHVENDERGGGVVAQKDDALLADGGMDDRFEQSHRVGFAEHRLGERGAVHALLAGGTRKSRLDRGDDAARRPCSR